MALSEQVRKGVRTRAALIEAAIGRFASEGFQRVSLTDIARDEDAWNAGLEVEWIAIRGPSGRAFALQHQVLT